MALVLANRVQETGTANTTVSFTLAGAVTGFQSFAVVGDTNTTYYSATDGSGNWEVGLGTYSTTGPTLTRTTVYASSNAGNAVTFSGAVNVFVTYPSGKSINLDASGNASALGTVSSGTWQGTTVGVAYGGTGVTSSSGANSVVLRDANENITVNRLNQGLQTITASGGTTILTAASDFNQQLVGTGSHTFRLPDATTLSDTTTFQFNNNATGTLTIQNNAATTVGTVAPGGAAGIALMDNTTSGGTWDVHGYLPENVTWGTNALALGSTVITGGTWQGGTIQPAYGGTGLTSFTTNGAVYATGTTTLTSGTLPVISGGTGTISVPTNGQLLIGNGSTYTVASLGTTTGISTTVGSGTLTINNTGVTSLAGTSPVTASASTGSVTMSLASGYGDTQNPYASKTANFFLAAPNGSAGAPTFRAVVAADIPTLNQNTTGSAGSVANAATFNNGGAGDVSGTTFNGSAARTISYNTIGAPSTTGTNATGTWGINITGNAATATTASNVNNGTLTLAVSGTGLSGSQTFTANQATNATFTVTSNATNANTASTIVARDASGNFSAGTITATLSGSATSAGSVSNSVTFNNGGAGGASGSTFNGSSALTVSYNTVGAPSTTGTNASGTWGISISGNAATATTANALNSGNNYSVNQLLNNTWYNYNDNDRNAGSATYYPNASTRAFRLAFVNASSVGTGGNYAGLMQFNPWDGTTASTGDASYQMAWGSTAANSGGIPQLNIRKGIDTTWNSWYTILHSGNYNSYAPTLTGTGASGTWGISISGNAATATSATTATTASNSNLLNNLSSTQLFNNMGQNHNTYTDANSFTNFGTQFLQGTTNGPGAGGSQWYMFGLGLGNEYAYSSYAMQVAIPRTPTGGNPYVSVRYREGGTWNSWAKIYAGFADTAGTITSQANSATITASTAATANQIVLRDSSGDDNRRYGFAEYFNMSHGVSGATGDTIFYSSTDNYIRKNNATGFRASLNVPTRTGGDASGTWSINVTGSAGSATNATNATNVAITNDTTTNATYYPAFMTTTSGNAGVRVSSTKLTFNPSTGNFTAGGNVTAYSDERLKTDWVGFQDNFVEQLATIKSGTYTRIDSGERQAGSSAQDWQKLLPEVVQAAANKDKTLTLAYGNAALVSSIELAKRVVDQEARINRLEALVAKLIGD